MATSSRRFPHLADALVLEQWADRIEARGDFPFLVRRVIAQTNDQVTSLDMAAAEGTGLPGYDGRVEASRGTPFVPHGASVWELGVGDPPTTKANKDYRTRTKAPLGIHKSKTTFVFATPRRWPGKTEWAERKRAEKQWADVKAFDAYDIETAFESAPAVQFWFSELAGLPVEGVRMIENWWDAFARSTQPNLTPELVLAGRADEAAKLLRFLEQDTRQTTISAPSTDDILAFVAATLLSTLEPERTDLLARTLIVHDASSLRRLDATTNLLVLLPFQDELRREAQLVRSHHVIFLTPEHVPGDIRLPRIDRDVFAAMLVESGVEKNAAEQFARVAHRSLFAFQAEAPARGAPIRGWASAFASRVVRRAWLAGGWQEARSGDTEALAVLFGEPYDDARAELGPFASGEDPIFTTVGGTWGLTSAEQAWQFGNSQLGAQDLAALETLVQTVLGVIDPALELPPDERWMAAVHGKTRIHSSDLRTGLAMTLAALGAFGQVKQVDGLGTAADWAAGMVRRLLGRANEDTSGDLWASLSDVLPLLAEAAPDQFLRAVQEGATERSEPLLAKMFIDRGDAFSVSSPHTGLLWALEGLAWSPDHAALAAKALARLAEIDPGGRLRNRPLASLEDFFRPWFPQTSLTVDRRIAVLDALRRDHPNIAWRLMLNLLPEHHGVGNYSHSPRFRSWKPESEGVTYGERWEFESAVGRRLLEDVETTEERWVEITERLSRFPPQERALAVDRLETLASSKTLPSERREAIWTELDETVRKHRSFSTAEWALPTDEVGQLASLAERFRPDDPLRAHKWLFDAHLPDMGYERDEYDYQEHGARVREARSVAVAAILEIAGMNGLLGLADQVEFPGFVGVAAALHPTEELDEIARSRLADENLKRAQFATGYMYERAQEGGLAWIREGLKKLEGQPLSQARLLQVSDDLPAAWQVAADLGPEVEHAYWQEFATWGRGDFMLVNEAAASLLEFGRPLAALDLMSLYASKDDRRVSPDLIVRALKKLIELPAAHPEPTRVSTYELQALLDYLHDSDIDEEQLGILEWQLLPGLGFDARSPVLERRLARDPAFFVDILSLVYRPRGAEADDVEVPEDLASNAYQLLDEWKIVPGSPERMGEVDGKELKRWVESARQLLSKAGRTEIGDVQIGKVLAHARGDDDGTWPTKPVRELLEKLANSEMEEGFEIQIRTNRGVTSRGVYAGGEQERELVKKYNDLASKIRDAWPRTAAVLASVARSYEREAQRHDEDVERLRQGMHR